MVSVSADGSLKGWDEERKCTIAKDIGKQIKYLHTLVHLCCCNDGKFHAEEYYCIVLYCIVLLFLLEAHFSQQTTTPAPSSPTARALTTFVSRAVPAASASTAVPSSSAATVLLRSHRRALSRRFATTGRKSRRSARTKTGISSPGRARGKWSCLDEGEPRERRAAWREPADSGYREKHELNYDFYFLISSFYLYYFASSLSSSFAFALNYNSHSSRPALLA